MGPYGSKNFYYYYSYKSQPKVFELLLNFLPNDPMFGIFEILKIEILTIFFFAFVTVGPKGVKILKRYSYKSRPKVFKLLLNFPPNGPHKPTLRIFEIFSYRFLAIFFRKFQIQHCSLWGNKDLNYLEYERS